MIAGRRPKLSSCSGNLFAAKWQLEPQKMPLGDSKIALAGNFVNVVLAKAGRLHKFNGFWTLYEFEVY